MWSVPRSYNQGMETCCEPWNIKINEAKTRGIYFSRSRRPPESHLTLNGQNIQFVNSLKYLGVIFDKKVTWRSKPRPSEHLFEYIPYSKVND
jgi:hypothetical protein